MASVSLPALSGLLHHLGWSYSVFWFQSPSDGKLAWKDGYCIHPDKAVQLAFYSLYEQCRPSFEFVGMISKNYQWLTDEDIFEGATAEQVDFFKKAGIQTVVCIPLPDGVLEIGTTNFIPHDESLRQCIYKIVLDTGLTDQSESGLSTNQEAESPTCFTEESSLDLDLCMTDDFDFLAKLIGTKFECQDFAGTGLFESETVWSGSLLETEADLTSPSSICSVESEKRERGAFQRWNPQQIKPVERSTPHGQWMLQRCLKHVVHLMKKHECKQEIDRDQQERHNHVMAERTRRQKHKELMQTLRSLLPNKTKGDKLSTLSSTVQYLKQLKEENELLNASNSEKDDHAGFRTSNGSCIQVMQATSTAADILVDVNKGGNGMLCKVLNSLQTMNLQLLRISGLDGVSAKLTVESQGKEINQMQILEDLNKCMCIT